MCFLGKQKKAGIFLAFFAIHAVTAGLAFGASERPFTFQFSLPDGAVFIATKTLVHIKKWERAGSGKVLEKETKVVETRTKFTVLKKEDGYLLTSAPVSIQQSRNGERFVNRLDTLFFEMAFTYDLDPDGRLVAIRGIDPVRKKYKGAALDQAIAELTNEWNERVGPFVGRSAAYGDTWILSKPSALFTGKPAAIRKSIRFAGPAECEGGPCVRTLHSLSKEPELKSEFYADAAEALDVDVTDIEMTGDGEYRIDPKTMFFHYESRRWTTKIRATSREDGDLIGTTENRCEIVTEYE